MIQFIYKIYEVQTFFSVNLILKLSTVNKNDWERKKTFEFRIGKIKNALGEGGHYQSIPSSVDIR